MYTYEPFYDHYVIKKDNEILYHVDSESEAKKEIFLLSSENIDNENINLSNHKNYTVYHLHTEDSLLDSCTNYKLYVDRAVELGQKAIGFSEHGNIYHWFSKWEYCKSKGIKYMHEMECYLTETLETNIRDNYHTVLIAKNKDGFKELNRLYKLSTQKDHTYYKPRLTFDEFLGISNNIIKISACLQSPLNHMYWDIVNSGGNKEREEVFIKLLQHYDYYEIQYHNQKEQIEYNQRLYEWSQMYNKLLIVGTDTHSLNQYKAECRTILQYGKTDDVWGDSENECDLTYKTYDELINMFEAQNSLPMEIVLEAIENTNVMSNTVEELEFDTQNKYPLLYGDKDEEVLWSVLKTKYKEKLERGEIEDNPKYWEQINEEMRVFKKIDMIGFMLFMSEIVSWARDNNIAVGFARGSCAGSTVAYISDITDVDPIKWHTIFSRFANENRVEAGDIDTDWYEDDRPKVYNYIINRFGLEKTAYILAVGTLADKSVIDVIGKAFNVKYANTLGLKYEDVKNKEDNPYNLNNIANIKKEYDKEPQRIKEEYSDLFYYYDGLVGCVVSQSQHPAGIIVSPITLEDNIGMFIGTDGQEILPIDMEECHNLGLIKFDILGLKSIGVIDKTCKLIGTNFPKAYQVNWEDQEVYEDMTKDHTAIFQFESDFAGKSLQTMQCKSVFDMSLVNACIRPSGESYRDMLLHKIPNKNPSEIIDKLLENNYGHLVYQEDTIAFLQQICGFSGSEADNVRRAIGRKQTDKLNEALPKILDGYCSKSNKPREIAEKEAKTFLKIIEDASSYQFGYNHSIAYTLLSYMCGYLRYYYPTEFCTSFLNCAKNEEDINNGTLLAHSKGCHIETPKFRFSTSEYGCNAETKTIYKGVGSIKNVGTECGDKLYNLKDNIYDTFVDLLFDIDENKCANKTDIDLLVKIDFFEEFGNINKLLCIYDIYKKLHKRSTFNVSELEQYGLEKEDVSLISEKTTEKRFSGVNIKELIKIISNNITVEEVSNIEHISYELGILGYTNYTDDSVDNGIYVISNMEENKYGTRFATLYNPKSAEYTQYKVKKSSYIDHPCDVGDIVKVVFNTQNKRKQVDGEWVEDKDNKETILKDYTIIKQFKVKEN